MEAQKLTDAQLEADQPRLEITFKKMDITNPPKVSLFKESNFVKVVNGQVVPVNKYSSYRVLNNRPNNPINSQR